MGVNMLYKAVIFDLDGTLLDTLADIADSFNAALARKNYGEFSVEEYRYFVGRGMDELITNIIEAGNLDPSEFLEIKNAYIEEYALRSKNKTKPYPGVIELLKTLKSMGILVAILSNKPHFQTEGVVEYYFKDFLFDSVYGKKPEFEIKPNPASALQLIKDLSVSKEEVLYVGDTNTDMETAYNAGFTKVGVTYGFRPKDELINAGADYTVDNALDILKIVKGEGNDFKSK